VLRSLQSACSSDASDTGNWHWGEDRTGQREAALVALPKSIAAIPPGDLATWAYHEVMAGYFVTVSAMPPLLLRSAYAGQLVGVAG
jgi:hypothetical protein